MFYHSFRFLIRFAVREFFSRIRVVGVPPTSGPVLHVGNHPNVALDSLLIGTVVPRPLFFLAKSVLFTGIAGHFFRALKMVPIYRSSDAPGETRRNEESFRAVIDKLAEGEGVVIFPEGTSIGQRTLLPLKTGAARIALSAAARGGVLEQLVIQPIGITYSDPERFRSTVTVVFGEPIPIAPWLAKVRADEANERAVVGELTTAIEQAIRAITAEPSDLAHIPLVDKIRRVYESRGAEVDDRQRLELVIKNVEAVAPREPEFAAAMSVRIDRYLELNQMFLLPGNVSLPERHGVLFLAVLPLVFLGVVLYCLPYQAAQRLTVRVKDRESRASAAFLWGLVLFPIWTVMLAFGFAAAAGCLFWALPVIPLLVFIGMVTNRELLHARMWLMETIWLSRVTPLEFVHQIRDDIIAELERKRVI